MVGSERQISHFDLRSFLQQKIGFHRRRRGGQAPTGLSRVLLQAGRVQLEDRDLRPSRSPDGLVVRAPVREATRAQANGAPRAMLLAEARHVLSRAPRIDD